jgi:hypothetical protein
MAMHLAVLDTSSVDGETQPHLDDFFRGRISYIKLCNLLERDSWEVDAVIADVVCENIRRNTSEIVLRH